MKRLFFATAMLVVLLLANGCGSDEAANVSENLTGSSETSGQKISWSELKDQIDPYKSKYEELRKKISKIVDESQASQQPPDAESIAALKQQCRDVWSNQIEPLISTARSFDRLVPDLQTAFTKLENSLTIFESDDRDLKNKILAANQELEMADDFYYKKFLDQYNKLNK